HVAGEKVILELGEAAVGDVADGAPAGVGGLRPGPAGGVIGRQVGGEGPVVDVDRSAGILHDAAGVIKGVARGGGNIDRANERPRGGVLLEQVVGVGPGDGDDQVTGGRHAVFEHF